MGGDDRPLIAGGVLGTGALLELGTGAVDELGTGALALDELGTGALALDELVCTGALAELGLLATAPYFSPNLGPLRLGAEPRPSGRAA